MYNLGVDVGGTSTRVGVITDQAGILTRCAFPTQVCKSANALVGKIAESVDKLGTALGKSTLAIRTAGLALPGILDAQRNTLRRSVNVPWLEQAPLGDHLQKRTPFKWLLFTDADAATWGEFIAAGAPQTRFVHLRLGTGVGCGIITDGKLDELEPDREKHLSLLIVDTSSSAIDCRCGLRGCLETIVSGSALRRYMRIEGLEGDLAELQCAAAREDGRARRVIDVAADALAGAIQNLLDQYNADVINIGGGVAASVPALVDEATRRLAEKSTQVSATVEHARLGDYAGTIGVGLLAAARIVQ